MGMGTAAKVSGSSALRSGQARLMIRLPMEGPGLTNKASHSISRSAGVQMVTGPLDRDKGSQRPLPSPRDGWTSTLSQKMGRHSEAIELIEAEVAKLEVQLSAVEGDEVFVQRKDSLLKSLRLLRQLSDYEVSPKAKIHSLPFPDRSGHFSEFRLLDDQETEERSDWTELEIEGEPVRAIVGDVLILNSNKR